MTKYIENLNLYLDAKKMSRILTGVQDITGTDMEKISAALGENTEYFLQDPFPVPQMCEQESEKVTFYAGEPAKEQEKIADEIEEKYSKTETYTYTDAEGNDHEKEVEIVPDVETPTPDQITENNRI